MNEMSAMIFDAVGATENLIIHTVRVQEPGEGEVRIRARAFGINSTEAHMRAGEWGDVAHI